MSTIIAQDLSVEGRLTCTSARLGAGITTVSGSGTYNMVDTDEVLSITGTSSGAVSIQLLEITAGALGTPLSRRLTIVDRAQNSSVNNITVLAGGSDTILTDTGAAASALIDDDGAAVTLMSDGSSQWFTVG